MRVEEIRGLCRCGKCDGLQLFGLVMKADNEADREQLEDILSTMKKDARARGVKVVEDTPENRKFLAEYAKLKAAINN